MSPETPRSVLTYVDTTAAAESLARRVAASARVAVDTEADSLHHYFEKVCLIQVTLDREDFIIDPLSDADLSSLIEALADRPMILHGADYDLRMLRSSFGFEPRAEVFDTMLAAQLLGFEQIGMAAISLEFFGVELPKHGQRSDWSVRPLPAQLLEYARNDTFYLEPMAARLEASLEEKGRDEWHRESCARTTAAAQQDRVVDPDLVWRIKGAGKLDRPALAILKELWLWRDAEARELDRPTFKVLGNQKIFELVVWAREHPRDDLSKGPSLPRNVRGPRLQRLKRALRDGIAAPEVGWPERFPKRQPRSAVRLDEALLKRLQQARDKVAERLEVSPPVLAPRASLESLALSGAREADEMAEAGRLMKWQAALLAPVFLPVLKGRAR